MRFCGIINIYVDSFKLLKLSVVVIESKNEATAAFYQLFHCNAIGYFVCKSKPNLFNTSVSLIHCMINLMQRAADLFIIWGNIVNLPY